MCSLGVKYSPPRVTRMWSRKMPPSSLEDGRLPVLDVKQLAHGGRCQGLEKHEIVGTSLPIFAGARFTRTILRSFKERIYLSAGASAGPNCSCPHVRYLKGVGHLSLRIRESWYRRSGSIRKHVVQLLTLMHPSRRPYRSEGGSRPSLVTGQLISKSASDKAREGEGRGGHGSP
jgi:hypothetical protein